MRRITAYKKINTDPGQGWKLDMDCLAWLPPDKLMHCISFTKGGFHLIATVKETKGVPGPWLHASLGQLPARAPSMTPEQLTNYQRQEAPGILQLFFGDMSVQKLPEDPRLPDMMQFALGRVPPRLED